MSYYDKDGNTIEREAAWALMDDWDYKRVARDYIGDVQVSTVWLGMDLGFTGGHPPIIFETMVFGGELDQETRRYATLDEAKAGHKAVLDEVRQAEAE